MAKVLRARLKRVDEEELKPKKAAKLSPAERRAKRLKDQLAKAKSQVYDLTGEVDLQWSTKELLENQLRDCEAKNAAQDCMLATRDSALISTARELNEERTGRIKADSEAYKLKLRLEELEGAVTTVILTIAKLLVKSQEE